MSRWFRFYDDALYDPKVQRLPGEKFKIWVNLLCMASKNGGELPELADIAYTMKWSEAKTSKILNEFYSLQLLDEVEYDNAPMGYAPHNWNGRQYKSDKTDPTNAERQARYRTKKTALRNADSNGSNAVTIKRPDTEQITEQKDAAIAAPETDEVQFFRRGKELLGPSAGGFLRKLIDAKGNSIPLARAALEQASTKENAREYLGAIIRGREQPADQRMAGRSW